ncbi:3D (Asp-Asp-Asp) domain-containing protein [Fontibacillus phaseoli]|uniref:3D (Asp-Asp-Asp) domain-containing protein n=1 Tax=Fontibacillus phaseoli TaxID=1416533 RepID=A0A369BMU9_9BACL|nr:3D domain-containing protein [Fontibacillus phaseoli]RCX22922.1 3D (Asp-Asp-Asp) domain-containing protein [Fontibacillus phaseoli]
MILALAFAVGGMTEATGKLPSEPETYVVTAYSIGDDYTPSHGITASGARVEDGITAACPRELPFGTRVEIEGVGERTCYDRGGKIKGKRIDVYIPEISDALKFGKRELEVTIIDEKGAD